MCINYIYICLCVLAFERVCLGVCLGLVGGTSRSTPHVQRELSELPRFVILCKNT